MKSIYTVIATLLFAFATANSFAQIPNNGFENWTAYGNGMTPDGWWCTNDSLNPSAEYFPVTRSGDHYPSEIGNYSIRLESDPELAPDWSMVGVAWPGDWSGSDNPSFPITGHPKALCGYYKYLPEEGDTMDIHWVLYNEGAELTMGKLINDQTVGEWTAFKIYLTDTMYDSADSARIMMASFNIDNGFFVHGNSVLYVDNLSFDALITTGIAPVEGSTAVSVYPNPANERITVAIPSIYSSTIKLEIFNVLGEQIFAEQFSGDGRTIEINVSEFAGGIYFVRGSSNDEIVFGKKIIIEK